MSENENLPTETTSPGEIVSWQKTRELMVYLQRRLSAFPAKERAFEVMASQAEKILAAAESDDGNVWDADEGGTISAKDFADGTRSPDFRIYSWQVAESAERFEAPFGCYINIQCSLLSEDPCGRFAIGENFVLNTGAPLIIVKLRALEAREMLPADAAIVAIGARSGDVLKLRPASKRAK